MLSALGSALGSEAASDLDSALLSDSDSALELPDDVLDDADDELLVLWEELPELAEEDEEDAIIFCHVSFPSLSFFEPPAALSGRGCGAV